MIVIASSLLKLSFNSRLSHLQIVEEFADFADFNSAPKNVNSNSSTQPLTANGSFNAFSTATPSSSSSGFVSSFPSSVPSNQVPFSAPLQQSAFATTSNNNFNGFQAFNNVSTAPSGFAPASTTNMQSVNEAHQSHFSCV
jgi:hypothetical protein